MDYENGDNIDFFSLIGIPAPSSTDSSNRENSPNHESQSEKVER